MISNICWVALHIFRWKFYILSFDSLSLYAYSSYFESIFLNWVPVYLCLLNAVKVTLLLWIAGWHLCSICEKNAYYMCYTCTYSLCKGCIKDAVILCVRGNKGFCETCMKTVMLIERNELGKGEKVCFLFSLSFIIIIYFLFSLLTLQPILCSYVEYAYSKYLSYSMTDSKLPHTVSFILVYSDPEQIS